MNQHKKAAAYHGIEGVRFAPKTANGYATGEDILKVLYAKSLDMSSLLEATEQYADDRLLFRVPNDKGFDANFGTTAPDPNLDKAAGFAMEGANGLMSVQQVNYARGAMYYEFFERNEDGQASKVKVWLLNCEVGKGTGTHTTDESSVTFGTYSYPVRVYGETAQTAEGKEYVDANGISPKVFYITCRPDDTGYATFGDSVPAPVVTDGGDDGDDGDDQVATDEEVQEVIDETLPAGEGQ